MNFYIVDNVYRDVIATGFKSEEEAEKYLMRHPRLKEYWYQYSVEAWTEDYAWGVTYLRDSWETGGTTFLLFKTWDEAVDWCVEHPFDLPEHFDYDSDIYQVDMTKGQ